MKRFEKIQKMNIDEMSKFFSTDSPPDFPHSACYICQYNEGLFCNNPDCCTNEYKTSLYKKWLNKELSN